VSAVHLSDWRSSARSYSPYYVQFMVRQTYRHVKMFNKWNFNFFNCYLPASQVANRYNSGESTRPSGNDRAFVLYGVSNAFLNIADGITKQLGNSQMCDVTGAFLGNIAPSNNASVRAQKSDCCRFQMYVFIWCKYNKWS